MYFNDRHDAAKKLINRLKKDSLDFDIILALPRGGVILGKMIADEFKKPLDIVIPRKITAPYHSEYAIGAITEDGIEVWNRAEKTSTDQNMLQKSIKKEIKEAKRRREIYLKDKKKISLENKSVLIVDDGIATGLTIKAAVEHVKKENPKKISIAVPVGPPDSIKELEKLVDQVVVLKQPSLFMAIGQFYDKFDQVSDKEVIQLLKENQ